MVTRSPPPPAPSPPTGSSSPTPIPPHAPAGTPTSSAPSNGTLKQPSSSSGQRFDSTNPGTLFVEILNELRVVFGGVAFGDQTMVIRRDALAAADGFPAQPLMEDVEASLRLQARGRVLYLGQEWLVSATKWRGKFSRRFPAVLRLVASYQLARLRGPAAAQACARKQYAEYYP